MIRPAGRAEGSPVDSTVADLMRRNLLDVFNEQDRARREAAIAVTYAEDVVWHEPDRVNRGRGVLAARAAELLAQAPLRGRRW